MLDVYLATSLDHGIHLFDYESVTTEHRQQLSAYIDDLQVIDPRVLSRNEQKAYWINFYNAATVQVILDNYPVDSIRKIRPNLFALSVGPWDKTYFSVAGEPLSLNNIEHGILRPIWQDPRLHFGLNCASIGCPNLLETAFTAKTTEPLLEKAARQFLNHPRAVEFVDDELRLSSLFDWYATDFGKDKGEILAFIKQYHTKGELDNLSERVDIEYHYDWSLNELQWSKNW